jgi:hypothetical protein
MARARRAAAGAASSAKKLSGPEWVREFPGSRSLDDLVDPFKSAAKAFVAALLDSGCSVTISSTLRPPERAYLMRFSTAIARNVMMPEDVPANPKVNIEWVHRTGGQIDHPKSRSAAVQMVQGYGIDPSSPLPAAASRHTEGNAIDMSISWTGVLLIRDARGREVRIPDSPRNGLNPQLHKVGATYKVIKALFQDDPHWSNDGH